MEAAKDTLDRSFLEFGQILVHILSFIHKEMDIRIFDCSFKVAVREEVGLPSYQSLEYLGQDRTSQTGINRPDYQIAIGNRKRMVDLEDSFTRSDSGKNGVGEGGRSNDGGVSMRCESVSQELWQIDDVENKDKSRSSPTRLSRLQQGKLGEPPTVLTGFPKNFCLRENCQRGFEDSTPTLDRCPMGKCPTPVICLSH